MEMIAKIKQYKATYSIFNSKKHSLFIKLNEITSTKPHDCRNTFVTKFDYFHFVEY
jgi:hypothetical protein